MMTMNRLSSLSLVAILAACGSGNHAQSGVGGDTATTAGATTTRQAPATQPAGARQPGGMSGMGTMGSMQQGGGTAAMMDTTAAQMRHMNRMTSSQMQAAMPAYRQTTANLLARMNSDMQSMKMTVSPEWTALMDSVRRDLVTMPALRGRELESFMSAHQARVERLMGMHRSMMQGRR